MKKVSLMFAVLVVLITSLITPAAHAYESSFFQKFYNREIHVTVQLTATRQRSYWMVVKRIDPNNNILEGKTNEGRQFIQIQDIVAVRVDEDTTHHVLNPHREY